MTPRMVKHIGNYTHISNETLSDKRLSFEARGVLMYILSKPERCEIDIVDICKNGKIKRDKLFQILEEIETAGYIDFSRGNAMMLCFPIRK
jgi:DNA-binding MarR family transcriptional regulator